MTSRFSAVLTLRVALLGLVGAVALVAAPVPAAGAPLQVVNTWRRAVFGSQIGASGLSVADLDGDGRPEILVGGSSTFDYYLNDFWQILRWDGTTYRQIWASLPESPPLRALIAVQADADGALEILTARGNEIRLYDGATRKLERKIVTPTSEIRSLAVADLDGDRKLEIIYSDPSDLFVADLATGALRWRLPGFGGGSLAVDSLAVGNLDDDAALEIVVAGATGRVIDGVTRQVEWTYPAGFGAIRLANLVGDSRLEIVTLGRAGIRAFDPRLRTLLWKRLSNYGASAMTVGNIEGDAHDEVIYGDLYRQLNVVNGSSGAGRWKLNAEDDFGTSAITVADPDGDGATEIVWASGSGMESYRHLSTVDLTRRQIEWSSVNFIGPFLGFDFGDVDADGRPEILFTCQGTNEFFGDGLWFVHDARNFNPEFQSQVPIADNRFGFLRLASANVDSDPQSEVFLTSSRIGGGGQQGALLAYDGKTHALEWRHDLDDQGHFQALAIADVDRDGRLELIASVGGGQSNADGLFVYVFDAATGALEWRSPSLSETHFYFLEPLRIAQLDDDPQPEIVIRLSEGSLRVLDAVKRTVEKETGPLGVVAFDTRDLDGDGKAEIVAATFDTLAFVDLATDQLEPPLVTSLGFIWGLRVLDLNGDGTADFLVATDGQVRIIDGASRVELWRSPRLGVTAGALDSLFTGDFDGDGQMEFAVNTGRYGLVLYEVRR
jgi:outer membrane protein assembly factor BamB